MVHEPIVTHQFQERIAAALLPGRLGQICLQHCSPDISVVCVNRETKPAENVTGVAATGHLTGNNQKHAL
jgi:hypothetical protein